jgi:hypothetical protein
MAVFSSDVPRCITCLSWEVHLISKDFQQLRKRYQFEIEAQLSCIPLYGDFFETGHLPLFPFASILCLMVLIL